MKISRMALPAIFCLALSVLAGISGCTQKNTQDPRSLTAMVAVEGSDTMASLIHALATEFMHANPEVPVSVSIDDSGEGIEALINKTTDLAAASRDLTEQERELAKSKGAQLKKSTVAIDSIAVIVNPKNPVSKLSLGELKDIYNGTAAKWSAVGGQDKPVNVFLRESTSGTYKYFQAHVLNGSNYMTSAKIMHSNEWVVKAVEDDPNGIGFVGLKYAISAGKQVKPLALSLAKDSPAVSPTLKQSAADYPLERPLYIFTDAQPKESVSKFVDFCLSPSGQKAAADAGYVVRE